MRPLARAGLATGLALVAMAVASWSAGTSSSLIASLPGPLHASEGQARLLTMLGQASARGTGFIKLVEAARAQGRAAPLDDVPFMVVGATEEQRGQSRSGERLYEQALLRNPRSRGAHFMLAGSALEQGNAELTLKHLASLARQNSAAEPALTQTLVAVVGDPRLDAALRRFLAEEPMYREALFQVMANDPALATRLETLATPRNAPPTWLPTLVATLVMSGRTDQAAVAWQRFRAGRDPRAEAIRDPDFRRGAEIAPFGWELSDASAGTASRGSAGLEVEAYGRETGKLAGQWMLLGPGRYRLATQSRGDIAHSLEWRVSCVENSARTIGTTPVGRGLEFVVPPNCPAQSLELWARPNDDGTSTSGTLSTVQLERTQ